jgi:hypothetical protein
VRWPLGRASIPRISPTRKFRRSTGRFPAPDTHTALSGHCAMASAGGPVPAQTAPATSLHKGQQTALPAPAAPIFTSEPSSAGQLLHPSATAARPREFGAIAEPTGHAVAGAWSAAQRWRPGQREDSLHCQGRSGHDAGAARRMTMHGAEDDAEVARAADAGRPARSAGQPVCTVANDGPQAVTAHLVAGNAGSGQAPKLCPRRAKPPLCCLAPQSSSCRHR